MPSLSKKEKIMIKVNNLLNTIMMILSFVLLIYFVFTKKFDRIFPCIAIYLVVYFPNLLEKTRYKLAPNYKLVYTIFIFLAHFLGSVINLYRYIWWFDLFAHFLSGILTFVVGLYILEKSGKPKMPNKLVNFLYLMGLVSLVALTWEIIEYSGDRLLGMNLQHNLETGVVDTMQDIIVATLGGLLSYCFFNKRKKRGE